MTVPFGFIPPSSSALHQLAVQAGNGGQQPPSNAPTATGTPSRLSPPTSNPATPDPLQTLSDTLISALNTGAPVTPATTAGPMYITSTDATGGTVDLKKIAILAGIAFGAWFLWKKYGKKAAS